MKLLVAITVAVVSYVALYVRRHKARARLAAIDEGKLCIACHGTELQPIGGNVRCMRCGHTVSLAGLRGASISDGEIDAVNKPDTSSN
ncbi:hypothetical protein [Polyangium aurulentum]|uniref:hypothetical protein n=1 Tax=Polyangium aurulentum TaxID=2567896 RepID=UPI0010AE7CC3|nr:hypothetical protein [Polyangium aurulentum]UQA55392.1 hypothetical protein E8A73_029080 [Polyangium aurulentum]